MGHVDWKKYLRILMVAWFLYFFYSVGLPLSYVVFFGVLFILVLAFRGKAYERIDKFLVKTFPKVGGLPEWARKVLVIVVFIVAYAVVKQILFELLAMAGFDVQQAMMESINESMGDA